MKSIRLLFVICFLAVSLVIDAQYWKVVKDYKQKSFAPAVPFGNYSGVAHVDGDRYVIVNDKCVTDGYCYFTIAIDSVSGVLTDVSYDGFVTNGGANRDGEGIVYMRDNGRVYIVGEADNRIMEYDMDGQLTGKEISLRKASSDFGYESLTYNASTRTLWTANESSFAEDNPQATPGSLTGNVIRLQSFYPDLTPKRTYMYKMDHPKAQRKAWRYAMGVSELTAMDDGSVLVLEREFFVPKSKIGAFVNCKIYEVHPDSCADKDYLDKHLVYEWRTKLEVLNRSIANYEGMCVGPTLPDGSVVLLLVSDSQNNYGGVLKDWFKTIVIRK